MTYKKKAIIEKMVEAYPDRKNRTYEKVAEAMLEVILDHRDDIFYVEKDYHLVKIRREFQ